MNERNQGQPNEKVQETSSGMLMISKAKRCLLMLCHPGLSGIFLMAFQKDSQRVSLAGMTNLAALLMTFLVTPLLTPITSSETMP